MSSSLVCPNGHLWEISFDGAPTDEPSRIVCPVCGQEFTAGPTDARTEIHAILPLSSEEISRRQSLPNVSGYEVIRVLGQGGMGKVYEARHVQLDRLVALKMISAEHASAAQRARFQTEGQALAKLHHPNIVQIYEVNESNGTPFFALELLEGGLDRKLAGIPQPPLQAAQLIETLARAIHQAHGSGIVHRDLKPGNILLTRDGVPKISDFGLAKRLEDDSDQTRTGDLLGTPAYMAPEQASGDVRAIGPLTDVYALGVILYEMLTGRPPFRGVTSVETLQLIRFTEPVSPKHLQPGVPRDLETICLKCMEKTPDKRYLTALELADDLARFHTNQPIRARRAGTGERLGKWVRRHPTRAALVAVILIAITALGILGAWSNYRLRQLAKDADDRSKIARAVVDDLYTKFAEEWLEEEPYKDPVRQKFLEKALLLYQKFAEESGDDPVVRRETAKAQFRMGQIHLILNQHTDAEKAYRQAIDLQQDLRDRFPGELSYRQDLANSRNWLGELFRQTGNLAEAERHFRMALELQESLKTESPRNPEYRKELARSHYNLAIVLMDTSRPDEAAKKLASAFDLLGALHDETPTNADYRHEYAKCFINRGVLHKEQRAFKEAEDDYLRAIELLQPLVPTLRAGNFNQGGPFRVIYRIDLAVAHRNLGNLFWSEEKHADAVREMTRGLDLLKRLAEDFPNRPAYQKKLADTLNSLGTVAASTKDYVNAEEYYREARETFERLVQDHSDVAEYQQLLGITLGNLGWLRSEQKDWASAREHFEQSIQRLEKALATNRKNPLALNALRGQLQSLAETQIRLGDHAGAVKSAVAMTNVYGDRGQDFYFAACFLARAMPLVEKDQSVVNRYADQALHMLTRARDTGGVTRLPEESEIFGSLLSEPRFKKVLLELGARTKS